MCHLECEIETLPDCEYFNNDENLPIYSREGNDVKQMFLICLNANVLENLICKKCPLRANENATFIIHQDHSNVNIHLIYRLTTLVGNSQGKTEFIFTKQ